MRLASIKIRELLAPVYSQACLDTTVSMRELADCFETIREHMESGDEIACWNLMKLDRKFLDKPPLFQLLVDLKSQYYSCLVNNVIENIKEVCKTDPIQAFTSWKNAYTRALVNWESEIYGLLCDTPFEFKNAGKKSVAGFKTLNKHIMDSEWVEAYPFFCNLGQDNDLTNEQRCLFEITAAEIKLFWMLDFKQSIHHIEKAKTLLPDSYRVSRIYGDYYSKIFEYEKAREYYLNAISMQPADSENYLGIGDCYKSEGKWQGAEQWYTDALSINFLNTGIASRFIYLYAESKLLSEHANQVNEMATKVAAIQPKGNYTNTLYNLYRDVANAWNIANNYVESCNWYKRAIELKPALNAAGIDLGGVMANNNEAEKA